MAGVGVAGVMLHTTTYNFVTREVVEIGRRSMSSHHVFGVLRQYFKKSDKPSVPGFSSIPARTKRIYNRHSKISCCHSRKMYTNTNMYTLRWEPLAGIGMLLLQVNPVS